MEINNIGKPLPGQVVNEPWSSNVGSNPSFTLKLDGKSDHSMAEKIKKIVKVKIGKQTLNQFKTIFVNVSFNVSVF